MRVYVWGGQGGGGGGGFVSHGGRPHGGVKGGLQRGMAVPSRKTADGC